MPRLAGLSGPPSSVVVSSPLKRHRAQGNPARVNRPNRPMVDRWSLQNFRAEPGRATLNERQLSALGQKAGNEHVPTVTDAPRPLEWHKPYREVAGLLAVVEAPKTVNPREPRALGSHVLRAGTCLPTSAVAHNFPSFYGMGPTPPDQSSSPSLLSPSVLSSSSPDHNFFVHLLFFFLFPTFSSYHCPLSRPPSPASCLSPQLNCTTRFKHFFSPLFVAALPPSSLKSKIAHQESQVASRQGRHSVTKQSKATSTDRRKKKQKKISRKERKTTQKTKGNSVANKRIVSIITRLTLGRLYLITIHFRLCQLHPF